MGRTDQVTLDGRGRHHVLRGAPHLPTSAPVMVESGATDPVYSSASRLKKGRERRRAMSARKGSSGSFPPRVVSVSGRAQDVVARAAEPVEGGRAHVQASAFLEEDFLRCLGAQDHLEPDVRARVLKDPAIGSELASRGGRVSGRELDLNPPMMRPAV